MKHTPLISKHSATLRKALLAVAMIAAACAGVNAQNAEADKLSERVGELYREKDFLGALESAKEVVRMYADSPGKSSLGYALALRNLLLIQYAIGEKADASRTVEEAIEAYRRQSSLSEKYKLQLAQILEMKADAFIQSGNSANAEQSLIDALKIRDEVEPTNYLAKSTPLFLLANIVRYRKNDDGKDAEKYAKLAFEARARSLPASNSKIGQAADLYSCMASRNGNADAAKRYIDDLTGQVLGTGVGDEIKTQLAADGVVINGKAIYLAVPYYSPEARRRGDTGDVKVRVTVDEGGNIISACALSGPKSLFVESESAARGSKYSPTTRDGRPIKVWGVIVYRFHR